MTRTAAPDQPAATSALRRRKMDGGCGGPATRRRR